MTKDFLIIGGGISGLLFAYHLSKADKTGSLIEASSNFGGAISSVTLATHTFDSGAESFSLANDATLKLIENLGLVDEIVFPEDLPAFLKSESDFYPIPKGLLGIPGQLDAKDLTKIFNDLEIAEAKRLDAQEWQIASDQTLGDLVEVRYGRVFVEKLLQPVVMGVYANSPYELEANSVLPGLIEKAQILNSLERAINLMRANNERPGANVASLKGGMHKLIEILLKQIKTSNFQLELDKKIVKVKQVRDGWQATANDGSTYLAKNMIIACPLKEAAAFFDDPKIVNQLISFKTQDVSIALVHIKSEKLNQAPLGTGALRVYGVDGRTAKATTHASAKWGWMKKVLPEDHHLVRFSFGYGGQLSASNLTEVDISKSLKDFYQIQNDDFELVEFKQIFWPGGLAQLEKGHQQKLLELEKIEEDLPGLIFTGTGVSGSGITSLVNKINKQIKRILL